MSLNEQDNKAQVIEWLLHSESIGISSETMARHIAELKWRGRFTPSIPFDVGDFGRCIKMIKSLPYPHMAISKCKTLDGKWPEIISRWDELVAMYESDASWEGECNKQIRFIAHGFMS